MKVGVVIGNGESRKAFDLNSLPREIPIYGCNALYRDYTPTVLFVRDEGMLQEINEKYMGRVAFQQKRKLIKNAKKPYYADPIISFEDPSGKHEVEISKHIAFTGSAAICCICSVYKLDSLYLIGFAESSNAYTGTKNYSSEDLAANAYTKELGDVFNKFPNTSFYRVTNQQPPTDGLRWSNVSWDEMLTKLRQEV